MLAGSGIGFAETAESALMARLLPDRLRGSGFGLLGGVQSLGDFASSRHVGLLLGRRIANRRVRLRGRWMLVSLFAAGAIGGGRSLTPTRGTVSRRR